MKNVMTIIFAVVVFALAAGCCACRKGKNNMPLVGTEWHLELSVLWMILLRL